jgi:hypothetical protein
MLHAAYFGLVTHFLNSLTYEPLAVNLLMTAGITA